MVQSVVKSAHVVITLPGGVKVDIAQMQDATTKDSSATIQAAMSEVQTSESALGDSINAIFGALASLLKSDTARGLEDASKLLTGKPN